MPSLDTLNSETIASDFEVAEEEIKKVKKIFNLDAANADLKKRQDILKKTDDGITGLFNSINANYTCMCITIPEDKKKALAKEIKAVEEKLEVLGRFKSTVGKIEELVAALTAFDNSLKTLDGWKDAATAELTDIRRPPETCFPRTELPEPWTSRRTLLPSLRSSSPMQRQSSTFSPRETRFLLMLRPSRTSSRGSPTTSRSSRLTQRLSATNTPTMSSTGPSTELVSRNSNLGWRVLRSLLLKVLLSHQTLTRSRLLMRRSRPLRRTVLTS